MKMNKRRIQRITAIALLSAIAAVLMLFDFPLFFAPAFYEFDFSEVPVLIGAFAFGPLAGVVIEAVKIVLNFAMNGTITMGIGEIANFLIGVSMVLPASIIYARCKTKKYAVRGLIVGVISMTIVGAVLNAYILLPAYAFFMEMEIADFVAMGSAVNTGITNIQTLILFAVVPFNLFKGIIVSLIVFLIYKKVSPLLKADDMYDGESCDM